MVKPDVLREIKYSCGSYSCTEHCHTVSVEVLPPEMQNVILVHGHVQCVHAYGRNDAKTAKKKKPTHSGW